MVQITRFLCFVLCAFVVACKSKNVDKTWQAVKDDNVVTITLSNRQNVQSYANVQTYGTYGSGIYYNNNFIESQLHRFMENLLSNVRDDLFSRITPQNFVPYYFIIPKFFNWNNVNHNVPKNINPNLFKTPAVATSTKTPNKVEPFTTNRPQANGHRRFPVETVPALRPRTIFTQDTTTPPPVPGTKISTTTTVNTERPETTTAEIQVASKTQANKDDKGPFFDDEDDTTRPIILLDTISPKSNRKLDKKLRRMPDVEHGSVQAGI